MRLSKDKHEKVLKERGKALTVCPCLRAAAHEGNPQWVHAAELDVHQRQGESTHCPSAGHREAGTGTLLWSSLVSQRP